MKAADRKLALKAARIHKRMGGNTAHGAAVETIARRLKVHPDRGVQILNRGLLIEQIEAHRLTANEMLVMATLARIEARRVSLGEAASKASAVDFAAGKRSGWCWSIVNKRLTFLPHFVVHTPNGHIWLTPAGWAFVWATGLILKNWKVPA